MLKRLEKLTEAEEAILEASERLPAGDVKHAAYAVLRERGLPSRRVEAWHYTDLRNAIKHFPALAESASQEVESLHDLAAIVPAARIAFVNGGRLDPHALPAGVSLSEEITRGGYRDNADAIGIINSLVGSHGVGIADRRRGARGRRRARAFDHRAAHGCAAPFGDRGQGRKGRAAGAACRPAGSCLAFEHGVGT